MNIGTALILISLVTATAAARAAEPDALPEPENTPVAKAEEGQPGVTGFVAGTMGLVGYDTGGVALGTALTLGGPEHADLDFYSKFGDSILSENWVGSVRAEKLTLFLPDAIAHPDADSPNIPVPLLRTQNVLSVGFSFQWKPSPINDALISTCLSFLKEGQLEATQRTKCEARMGKLPEVAPTPAERRALLNEPVERELQGLRVGFGARLLYTPDEVESLGATLEIGGGYFARDGGLYLGTSLSYLGREQVASNDDVRIRPEVTIWRSNLYAFVQAPGDPTSPSLHRPRFGAFLNYSRCWYDNDFAQATQKEGVAGFSVETGFFFSGQLSGGFSGVLSLAAVRPYRTAADSDWQFMLLMQPTLTQVDSGD